MRVINEYWSDRSGEWLLYVRPLSRLELDGLAVGQSVDVVERRPRGNQDYASLHLGRGTKWAPPRPTASHARPELATIERAWRRP